MMTSDKLLKFVPFSKTSQWNVKYFFSTQLHSVFPLSAIGDNTIHITEKTKLFNEPERKFSFLGISNETGMFDAYTEYGKNINQPYIRVQDGCLAYNPYRINVGSVGLKTPALKNEYISPAYVVFRCRQTLLPEYLLLVLKSSFFHFLIKENTTGSVRQTLSYKNLSKIEIPLPPLSVQEELVRHHQEASAQAQECESQAAVLEKSIESRLFEMLAIPPTEEKTPSAALLGTTRFRNLIGWGAKLNSTAVKPQELFRSARYPNVAIEYYCKINPRTTIPDKIQEVSFIPMECVSDRYGEISEQRLGPASQSKGYTLFQENDILWAKITPCMQNGKCAIARNLHNGYGYGSTEFHVFRTNEKVLPEYLYCFLRSHKLRHTAVAYFTGSAGQQRVGTDFLSLLTIPWLPISSADPSELTQQSIVEEVFRTKKKIKDLYTRAEELRRQAKEEFEGAISG